MKSYKQYMQWKTVNEAVLPTLNLGISHPQTLGGLRSNMPGIGLSEKKKMNGKVVVDEPEDDVESSEDEGDEGDCSCKKKDSFCKKMKDKKEDKKDKKKKKKHMEDELDDDMSDDSVSDDDVNDVETPGDEDDHDHDDHDDDEDDHDHDDHDDDDDHDEEDHDDKGAEDDAPKFGFMKDKKKGKKDKKEDKKKKDKKKVEESFWSDVQSYHMPKSSMETEEDFFNSLARQYGNPKQERFNSGIQGDGVNEDLLLTPDQEALIASMPNPGEVGYAPSQRLGHFAQAQAAGQPELADMGYGETSYEESVEESSDYEVLSKYFSEDVARELIEKRRAK